MIDSAFLLVVSVVVSSTRLNYCYPVVFSLFQPYIKPLRFFMRIVLLYGVYLFTRPLYSYFWQRQRSFFFYILYESDIFFCYSVLLFKGLANLTSPDLQVTIIYELSCIYSFASCSVGHFTSCLWSELYTTVSLSYVI